MLKIMSTLWRARAAEAAEALADAHALSLLDQHIRDASADLEKARRALAVATAQDAAEAARTDALRRKHADLEARALAALGCGREDLAAEAAQAIADLEADLASATAARASFAREIDKLRAMTADAERRLVELERGRRAARAAEAVRRLREHGGERDGGGALRAAEATLKRLRERQLEDEAADRAMDAMEGPAGAELVAAKLESAGFGTATRPTAASVLERLKQKQAA